MLSATPHRRGPTSSPAPQTGPSGCITRRPRTRSRQRSPNTGPHLSRRADLYRPTRRTGTKCCRSPWPPTMRGSPRPAATNVFLWDVSTAQTTRRFGSSGSGQFGHSSRVNCVAFGGQDDSLVVSGGFDTTVRVWDTKSGGAGGGKPVQILTEARDAVIAVVARGAEIVAASVDGRVRSYDVRMGRVTTDVFAASVTSLSLTRDGRSMLVSTLDNKVRLMDRANGACLKTYEDESRRNEDLRVQAVFGGKERYVIAGDELTAVPSTAPKTGGESSEEGRLWVWDLMTGKVVTKLSVPWGPGPGEGGRKRIVGRDGKEKERKNVVSCIAWKEGGYGDQFCVGGTSGVATVFGPA